MRAFSAMLLFSLVGCDTLWGNYITLGNFVLDGGSGTGCDAPGGCDLAGSDGPSPDLRLSGCSSDDMCGGGQPFCDLNTGLCTDTKPPVMAFPQSAPFQTTIALNNRYFLMATGDYDNDGITDIAVSGIFSGLPNANSAAPANVDVYLGNGMGGFTQDTSCSIPSNDAPVHLLTVPTANRRYNGILVATYSAHVYYCARVAGVGGTWTATLVGTSAPNGFRQLALAHNAGQATPDLIIRTSKNLFLEPIDPSTQGSVDVYRTTGTYVFNGPSSQASSTGIAWMTPIRPTNAAADYMALTWDDPTPSGPNMGRLGVEFYYTDPAFATNSQMYSSPVNMAGPYFSLFNKPLRTATVLHTTGQDPSILYTVSQQQNYLAVLYGAMVPTFTRQTPVTQWNVPGIMLPYAGDANGDGQDEIGLYTSSAGGPAVQRLQLLSYKNGTITTTPPIADITYNMDNFRGMALEYLGDSSDRRRLAKRKDLITLAENPGGSRLLIVRANLNYQFP